MWYKYRWQCVLLFGRLNARALPYPGARQGQAQKYGNTMCSKAAFFCGAMHTTNLFWLEGDRRIMCIGLMKA